MAEYIDCRRCDSLRCDGCNLNTLANMLNHGKFDCIMGDNHTINPAADVAEVRHGEWLSVIGSWSTARCSECNWKAPYIEYEYFEQPNYCPNCGAKMDGKGEGE